MTETSQRVVVFDVETTGLNPETDQIIELTCQEGLGDGGAVHTWRMRPDVPIAPEAQKVHGITAADVAECPRFADLEGAIRSMFDAADVLVGYNVGFDLDFVEAEFRRAGHPIRLRETKVIVDVLRLWRVLEPRSLGAAHKKFVGSDHAGAHSAAGDVAATGRVLAHMLPEFGLADASWTALAERCEPDRRWWIGPSGHVRWLRGEPVFGFGRYRDVALLDVAQRELSYLQWIQQKSDLPRHVKSLAKGAAGGLSPEAFRQRLIEFYGPPPSEEPPA